MPDFLSLYEDCTGTLGKVVGTQGSKEILFVTVDSLLWFKILFKRVPISYSGKQNIFTCGTHFLDDSIIICLPHNKKDKNKMN